MINPFQQVNWKPDTTALRSFAKSLVIGFPIIALVLLVISRLWTGEWAYAGPAKIASIGVCAGLLFLCLPFIARPFYFVWYSISCVIGLIMGNVLLTVFYFSLFTLIGFLRRTIGTSPIKLKLDRNSKTYWQDAGPPPSAASYFNQF
jgi:hypothetical protein